MSQVKHLIVCLLTLFVAPFALAPIQPARDAARCHTGSGHRSPRRDQRFHRRQAQGRVEKAQKLGIDTLILDIDTPGGAVGAALEITRLLKQNTENLHTIAYVHPTAYSAGTMIALACDEIAMAPAR
jgi:membrane-bound ClpP family serine protease